MKCPYCGAEAHGRFCEYCDSEMPGYHEIELEKERRSLDRVEEEVQKEEKPKKEEKKPKKEKKSVNPNSTVADVIDAYLNKTTDWKDKFATVMFDRSGKRKMTGKVNEKLFSNLGIRSDENIYLIHDDSIFGRGKSGFAITSEGFRCLDMFDTAKLTTWDALMDVSEITANLEQSLVLGDNKKLIYCGGDNKEKKELLKLAKSLKELYEANGASALI